MKRAPRRPDARRALCASLVLAASACGGAEQPPLADEAALGKGDWLGGIELKILREVAPLHGEPQVIPDCADSDLQLAPCQQLSERFVDWLNRSNECFADGLHAATGERDRVTRATLHCEDGIVGSGTTAGGYKRQHVFRRACDGRTVQVNGQRFHYLTAVRDANSRDRRFFVAFLDCWGTAGVGADAAGRLTWDANRGVRDWREDPARHSDHYHLSRPCLPWTCGGMAYE